MFCLCILPVCVVLPTTPVSFLLFRPECRFSDVLCVLACVSYLFVSWLTFVNLPFCPWCLCVLQYLSVTSAFTSTFLTSCLCILLVLPSFVYVCLFCVLPARASFFLRPLLFSLPFYPLGLCHFMCYDFFFILLSFLSFLLVRPAGLCVRPSTTCMLTTTGVSYLHVFPIPICLVSFPDYA